jgi:hypothetical protein
MDFQPNKNEPFADAFQAIVDDAMEIEAMEREERNYLGGSRLGEECVRKLGYEFHRVAKDEGRHFKGKTLRIFDMGHDGEERMAGYLRKAGFTLLTERPDGQQFGFGIAWNETRGCYAIAGHIDGVLTAGPATIGTHTMAYPCLWENKALGGKSWNDCKRKGVIASKPVYYAQMQIYMAYLDLADYPGLFTALNRDTGDIYPEIVQFAPAAAQAASDKGVQVVSSEAPEHLPRGASSPDNFLCKWCDYRERCWAEPAGQRETNTAAPSWMGPGNGS